MANRCARHGYPTVGCRFGCDAASADGDLRRSGPADGRHPRAALSDIRLLGTPKEYTETSGLEYLRWRNPNVLKRSAGCSHESDRRPRRRDIRAYRRDAFARERLHSRHEVVVISPNANWNWIPSNIWVGVGLMRGKDVTFPLAPVYRKLGITFVQGKALGIYPEGAEGIDPGFSRW